jgi:hypothetical protein
VDFLLHEIGRVVKKTRVKSHDRLISLGHRWPATDEIEAPRIRARLMSAMPLTAARKRTSRDFRVGPFRDPAERSYKVSMRPQSGQRASLSAEALVEYG